MKCRAVLTLGLLALGSPGHGAAQQGWIDADPSSQLPQDIGVAGVYGAVQRLSTTASLMHTTAHPDDEQAGMLTFLARGHGVRTSLLTLNRGEGGANAIGEELFDALGAIRTEELLLAGRTYGLSRQYFTNAVDYGFSKTLEEAFASWDREAVLADMVRAIRTERPLVVVSRFHGSERDGHGHHQAAGVLTREAVEAAADPARFADQIGREGLRPWRVRRLYRGGVQEGEAVHAVVSPRVYSPMLGTTFDRFAAEGWSLQRSQTAGRVRPPRGSGDLLYEEIGATSGGETSGFFEGLDTSLSGIFDLTEEVGGDGAIELLRAAERGVLESLGSLGAPKDARLVSQLAEVLGALRAARDAASDAPEARLILARKISDAQRALALATGIRLRATAYQRDSVDDGGAVNSVFRVAGDDRIDVGVEFAVPDTQVARSVELGLEAPPGWSIDPSVPVYTMSAHEGIVRRAFRVHVPAEAGRRAQYFVRASIHENRYAVRDSAALTRPWGLPPLVATASVSVGGQRVTSRSVVRGEESDLPRGVRRRELRVVPAVTIDLDPAVHLLSLADDRDRRFEVSVQLRQSADRATEGEVSLAVPDGWQVTPARRAFTLSNQGETARLSFVVDPTEASEGGYSISALAHVGGRTFSESEQVIQHPDLETRELYRIASATVRILPIDMAPVRVAYVMGVGDEIPAAIERLGGEVTLLDDAMLAAADLARFDAIVIGTRAYAVRPTLVTQNPRLLEYISGGGHLVVLYQTPEFDAERLAPHHAVLPQRAEEVSEEDAVVRLLAPDHRVLNEPNRITPEDFAGWVEQRGSKFFSEWADAFTPLVETHDRGQAEQRGIWLTAPYGVGHYTYLALALHRQTPYGVPGAYRILANVLSLGQFE